MLLRCLPKISEGTVDRAVGEVRSDSRGRAEAELGWDSVRTSRLGGRSPQTLSLHTPVLVPDVTRGV